MILYLKPTIKSEDIVIEFFVCVRCSYRRDMFDSQKLGSLNLRFLLKKQVNHQWEEMNFFGQKNLVGIVYTNYDKLSM